MKSDIGQNSNEEDVQDEPDKGGGSSTNLRSFRLGDNGRFGSRASIQRRSEEFWRLWVEHQNYLKQLASRWMSGNGSDAEDLLSRAAIRSHDRYIRDAHKIKTPRSWFARVLHNLCMDEHRKRSAHHRLLEKLHPDQAVNIASGSCEAHDPETLMIVGGSFASAVHVIKNMPDRLREPFILRFIYQYSNQEIARQLDITEVNVRKRIQLGRSIMRDNLEPL